MRLFTIWLCFGMYCAAIADCASQPNIILIIADDLGYGDLGCYGSEQIASPRLDQMAQEGVRFTDFYVASPFCSPSRAAILTGRLPARCAVPYVLFPSEHTGLPPKEVTIAELLKTKDYATACVGKWHLGWRREFRPQQQGFDVFYGMLHTNDIEEWQVGTAFHQLSSFEPMQLRRGDDVVESPVDQTLLTQKYTEQALDFIRQQANRPFFLYLAHTMPHVPQYASPAFAGKSKSGLYGDCVEEIDWSTGRILDLLKELQLDERTLVVFTSDNGAGVRNPNAKANANQKFPGRSLVGSNGALRGGKGSTFEGGIRVPCIARWPKCIPGERVDATPWSALDLLPTIAKLAEIDVPSEVKVDGEDAIGILKGNGSPENSRVFFHYFGVQLQAVREGAWKLYLPIDQYPNIRFPSLWYRYQAGLFERHHRLWPKPTLYNLSDDLGEKSDVSAEHLEIVARLLERSRAFDRDFQKQIAPVVYLPGPNQPTPGQVRRESDMLNEWITLSK